MEIIRLSAYPEVQLTTFRSSVSKSAFSWSLYEKDLIRVAFLCLSKMIRERDDRDAHARNDKNSNHRTFSTHWNRRSKKTKALVSVQTHRQVQKHTETISRSSDIEIREAASSQDCSRCTRMYTKMNQNVSEQETVMALTISRSQYIECLRSSLSPLRPPHGFQISVRAKSEQRKIRAAPEPQDCCNLRTAVIHLSE